jgi:Ni,Fe-hydrogenase III large subunit
MGAMRFRLESSGHAQLPVSTWETGDVFARAYVRWLEIQRSVALWTNNSPRCRKVHPE